MIANIAEAGGEKQRERSSGVEHMQRGLLPQEMKGKAATLYEGARGLLDRAFRIVGGESDLGAEQYPQAVLTEQQRQVLDQEVVNTLSYIAQALDQEGDNVRLKDKVSKVLLYGSAEYTHDNNHFRTRTENAKDPSDVDILVLLDMEEKDFDRYIKEERGVERGFSWGTAEGMTRAFTKIPSKTGEVDHTEIKFVTQSSADRLLNEKKRFNDEGNRTIQSALNNGRELKYP